MVSSVEIGIRVRPPVKNNQVVEDVIINTVPKTKQVIVGDQNYFSTDYVFWIDSAQSYLYDTCVLPQVNHLLDGFDVSVVVFGKSRSGKTFTLFGPGLGKDDIFGIVPRAARHIYNTLARWQNHKGLQFKVSISFFEILNGDVNDLISTTNQAKEYRLKINEKGLTIISGVEVIECLNANEVFGCLKLVLQHRKAAWTKHVQKSESHLFFIFTIEQRWTLDGKIQSRMSTGTFIELGSCETTTFCDNTQLYQQNYNKDIGLIVLSQLMLSLTNNCWSSQVNVDNTLNILLKDAFNVSVYTLLLCCLSPSSVDMQESIRYLQLVDKFKMVFGQKKESEEDVQTVTTSQELCFDTDESLARSDAFTFQFAASQWQKLVVNAEDLFSRLVQQGLSKDAKQQIEQWLFLKQEFEECLSNEASISREKESHSLERIDEVTESETNSTEDDEEDVELEDESELSDSGEISSFCSGEEAENSISVNTKKQDFNTKLVLLLDKFCEKTDAVVIGELGPFKSVKKSRIMVREKRRRNSKDGGERRLSKEEKHYSLKNSVEEKHDLSVIEKRNSRQSPNQEIEERLRDEITNLRKTRDFLVEQRRGLDTKLNRDKCYTKTEERKFIELDEAIEAIDATIEFKNGTICGRSVLESREESEQVLIDRLMKLNSLEIRSLLCKYFKKTVDLREAGRKLEEQIAELDQRLEAQQWKITALSSALQQAQLDNERRLITVTREHEEKLHLMFRHYTGSSSSTETSEQQSNKAILGSGQQAIPQQNLKKLGGTLSRHTTKVTRVKNKLIIQQSSKKASN